MEGEKCACEEEVVHGMEFESTQRGDDEHQEKEEEQRDRGGVTDFSGQRAGLEVVGHGHANLKSGDQVRVTPGEVPAVGSGLFGGRRKGVVGEVYVFEVGVHGEQEIVRLRDSVSELVAPTA